MELHPFHFLRVQTVNMKVPWRKFFFHHVRSLHLWHTMPIPRVRIILIFFVFHMLIRKISQTRFFFHQSQIFTSTIHHATSKDSNHPHFYCIPNVNKKVPSFMFFFHQVRHFYLQYTLPLPWNCNILFSAVIPILIGSFLQIGFDTHPVKHFHLRYTMPYTRKRIIQISSVFQMLLRKYIQDVFFSSRNLHHTHYSVNNDYDVILWPYVNNKVPSNWFCLPPSQTITPTMPFPRCRIILISAVFRMLIRKFLQTSFSFTKLLLQYTMPFPRSCISLIFSGFSMLIRKFLQTCYCQPSQTVTPTIQHATSMESHHPHFSSVLNVNKKVLQIGFSFTKSDSYTYDIPCHFKGVASSSFPPCSKC